MTNPLLLCPALALAAILFACGDDGGSASGPSPDASQEVTDVDGLADTFASHADLEGPDSGADVLEIAQPDSTDVSGPDDADVEEPAPLADPEQAGPFATAVLDGTMTVSSTGHDVAVHVVYPTSGPLPGPYPVVLMGHGFMLPPSQYYSYLERLASFGYVAMTVDFPAGAFNVNNVAQAHDMLAGLDWASTHSELGPIADVGRAATSGHSLGGKVALLAATMDDRVKASFTLDPVDSSTNCSATDCPDVSELLPIAIPTGFMGETVDATGLIQACAPAADNFQTFYANAAAPSLEVEVLRANHMRFLDDVTSCGLACLACNASTVDDAQVNAMAKALMVAFFERHLRGETGYDTYLVGPEAQARYVDSGRAAIQSK